MRERETMCGKKSEIIRYAVAWISVKNVWNTSLSCELHVEESLKGSPTAKIGNMVGVVCRIFFVLLRIRLFQYTRVVHFNFSGNRISVLFGCTMYDSVAKRQKTAQNKRRCGLFLFSMEFFRLFFADSTVVLVFVWYSADFLEQKKWTEICVDVCCVHDECQAQLSLKFLWKLHAHKFNGAWSLHMVPFFMI